MTSPVTFWQIVTPQPDESAAFYSRLFDWRIGAGNELHSGSERGIDGGVWPAPTEAQSFVQLFIEVADVDATIARGTSLGAKVLVPKMPAPGGGEVAILHDPFGLSFGVVSKRVD